MNCLRVIRHGGLHPCQNMALDEALLRSAGPPTLRVYGWSPPGLSLGYFQAASDFQSVPGDHVLVRRITGGSAIYHTNQITFALTADAGVLPSNVPASYELVHGAVAAALEQNGVATATAEGQPGSRQPWCFAAPHGADLVNSAGEKVLGSAQRRLRRPSPRILHQGSLIVSPPATRAPLVAALVGAISRALALAPEPGEPTVQEQALADTLRRERYESPRFTWRR